MRKVTKMDILVFGGGYGGKKRSIREKAGTRIQLKCNPVQSTRNPEFQPNSCIFDLKTFWNSDDGNEYLYAVNGPDPTEEEILISIRRHKPKPIT